jgi:rubrerythrin
VAPGWLLFTDKLAERLAFERASMRLYEALLTKFDDFGGSWPAGPDRGDLERARDQERRHFLMLQQTLEQLGSDPAYATSSADLHLVAAMGLPRVLADPRTSVRQGVEALLIAELVDNDCWESLIDLARTLGHEEAATDFEAALKDEREHLRRVRGWLAAGLTAELGITQGPPRRATKVRSPPRRPARAATSTSRGARRR